MQVFLGEGEPQGCVRCCNTWVTSEISLLACRRPHLLRGRPECFWERSSAVWAPSTPTRATRRPLRVLAPSRQPCCWCHGGFVWAACAQTEIWLRFQMAVKAREELHLQACLDLNKTGGQSGLRGNPGNLPFGDAVLAGADNSLCPRGPWEGFCTAVAVPRGVWKPRDFVGLRPELRTGPLGGACP